MKFLFSLWLFLFGCSFASAQNTFTVQGSVHDFHDKTPLTNAEVIIGDQKTFTDSAGQFIIKNMNRGGYQLLVKHPACKDFTQNIFVDKNLNFAIQMEHHLHEIETVHLHRNVPAKNSAEVSTLLKSDIERHSTENLGNLLTRMSGVSALTTGHHISKPMIHGLYGSRISILINGVRMAEQEWGAEHAPNVDPGSFDHVDVIKGASALRYGNEATGGVIVLEQPVLPKKDTLFGNVQLSALSNGKGGAGTVQITKIFEDQWFVKTGGRYQKSGDQYIPHHTLQNTGMQLHALNFSFGKRSFLSGFEVSYNGINQEFGIYKGAHLASPEDFYNAINLGQNYFMDNFSAKIYNPKQEVEHHIAQLSAYRRFANFGMLTFQYGFQLNRRKEYDIRRGGLSEVPSMDLRLITHSASLIHLLERRKWSWETGITAVFQDNFPNPETKARRLIPDYYRYDAGIFSVFKYSLNEKLHSEFGARYDFYRYDAYKYYDADTWNDLYASVFPEFFVTEAGSRILARTVLDFHNLSVNFGLVYQPWTNFEVKFNISQTQRAPNAAELFSDGLHHSAAVMEEGDLRIKNEKNYQINLTFGGKFGVLKGLFVNVNPYLTVSPNFIYQLPTGVVSTNRGVFPVWSYRQTRARIFGADADLELGVTNNVKVKSAVSLLKGDDLANVEPMILMMPARWRNSVEFSFEKPLKFYINLENQNTFRQKRFPVRNLAVTFIKNGSEISEIVDFSTPPGAYSIFGISMGADVLKNLNFNLQINNILNTKYQEYLNRLRYFMPEPGRNFVATIKYQF